MICPQVYRETGNGGGVPDDIWMRTTFLFGMPWPEEYRPLVYAQNPGGESQEIDQSTGIVYPVSRLREDGFGRTVADTRALGPSEDAWPY